MNANTLKHLQHFVGRVCSIISTSMNRAFDEKISREHFVIRIQEINAEGIWGTHPYNDEIVSYFAMPHIISIHQEIELDPNNPEHAEMIKEYEKKTGQKVQSDIGKFKPKTVMGEDKSLPVIEKTPAMEAKEASGGAGDATFVDVQSLEKLAEQSRRTFEAYNLLGKK